MLSFLFFFLPTFFYPGEITNNKQIYIIFFFFSLFAVPCGLQDLSSQPGTEPGAPAVNMLSPNHWTTREFLGLCDILLPTTTQTLA